MGLEGGIFLVIGLVTLGIGLWALIDCALRPAPAFVAAEKLDKGRWVLILLACAFVLPWLPLIGLFAVVGSIVYLVDVRPAVREVQSGGRW